MITEDQTAVTRLKNGLDHPRGCGHLEVIETHASVVFLAGARAWKLKAGSPLRLSGLLVGKAPQDLV